MSYIFSSPFRQNKCCFVSSAIPEYSQIKGFSAMYRLFKAQEPKKVKKRLLHRIDALEQCKMFRQIVVTQKILGS